MKTEITSDNYPDHYAIMQALFERVRAVYSEFIPPIVSIVDDVSITAAQHKNGVISFNETFFDNYLSDIGIFEDIIAHELGHMVDPTYNMVSIEFVLHTLFDGINTIDPWSNYAAYRKEQECGADHFMVHFSSHEGTAIRRLFDNHTHLMKKGGRYDYHPNPSIRSDFIDNNLVQHFPPGTLEFDDKCRIIDINTLASDVPRQKGDAPEIG